MPLKGTIHPRIQVVFLQLLAHFSPKKESQTTSVTDPLIIRFVLMFIYYSRHYLHSQRAKLLDVNADEYIQSSNKPVLHLG